MSALLRSGKANHRRAWHSCLEASKAFPLRRQIRFRAPLGWLNRIGLAYSTISDYKYG